MFACLWWSYVGQHYLPVIRKWWQRHAYFVPNLKEKASYVLLLTTLIAVDLRKLPFILSLLEFISWNNIELYLLSFDDKIIWFSCFCVCMVDYINWFSNINPWFMGYVKFIHDALSFSMFLDSICYIFCLEIFSFTFMSWPVIFLFFSSCHFETEVMHIKIWSNANTRGALTLFLSFRWQNWDSF